MPAGRILLSLEAERDLDELFDHIARDSGLPRADAVRQRLEGIIALLAGSPGMGRLRRDLPLDPPTHSFAVYPWVILYDPLADDEGILVLRVIDGRRDLPRHLGG